jgi:hypothetical protein
MPIPGISPKIMTKNDFDNLTTPASLYRFGKISDEEKKNRLDWFIDLISVGNQNIEYVIQLRAKDSQDITDNLKFVYWYLTKNRKIKTNRISFVIAPRGDEETQLWLIPNKNMWFPDCLNCSVVHGEDKTKISSFIDNKKQKK